MRQIYLKGYFNPYASAYIANFAIPTLFATDNYECIHFYLSFIGKAPIICDKRIALAFKVKTAKNYSELWLPANVLEIMNREFR